MDFQRSVYSFTFFFFFFFVNITSLFNRVGQSVASLLRRLGIDYQGNESRGKIRISGLTLKRWFQPKLASPFTGKLAELGSSQLWLGKGIMHQQRNIRTGNLSLDWGAMHEIVKPLSSIFEASNAFFLTSADVPILTWNCFDFGKKKFKAAYLHRVYRRVMTDSRGMVVWGIYMRRKANSCQKGWDAWNDISIVSMISTVNCMFNGLPFHCLCYTLELLWWAFQLHHGSYTCM